MTMNTVSSVPPGPDTTGAIREAIECVFSTQKEMGKDIAELAVAATEISHAMESLTHALSVVAELQRAVEQLGDTVMTYTGKLGELFDQQQATAAMIGRYISDQSKQDSSVRKVSDELRALRATIGQR